MFLLTQELVEENELSLYLGLSTSMQKTSFVGKEALLLACSSSHRWLHSAFLLSACLLFHLQMTSSYIFFISNICHAPTHSRLKLPHITSATITIYHAMPTTIDQGTSQNLSCHAFHDWNSALWMVKHVWQCVFSDLKNGLFNIKYARLK